MDMMGFGVLGRFDLLKWWSSIVLLRECRYTPVLGAAVVVFGGCCKGRRDRRMFSYVDPAFAQFPCRAESMVTTVASLFPLWWPMLLWIDALEETVLVRLGANELDATE